MHTRACVQGVFQGGSHKFKGVLPWAVVEKPELEKADFARLNRLLEGFKEHVRGNARITEVAADYKERCIRVQFVDGCLRQKVLCGAGWAHRTVV